ncbi:MAG: hypothetical protein C0501_25835 [Isosphaera sp.]|nr:hypothetical protein [Isosphaera sp.]
MSGSDFESTYRDLMRQYMDVNLGPSKRLDILQQAAVMAQALGDAAKQTEVAYEMNRLKQKYRL